MQLVPAEDEVPPIYAFTEQRLDGVTTMEAPMAEGLPEEANGIGDFKKRQRQNHAPHRQQFTRAASRMVDSR